VLFSDVLHHVPIVLRDGLLRTAGRLVAPGGLLVIKESCRAMSPGYPACVVADRYVGGDTTVSFMTESELDRLVTANVPSAVPVARMTMRPWTVNVLLAYRT
jgi:2-polyprenyl-3-methyl-5-hydroxy-6-metoxy-1,4-benzoquinol methylase